MNNPPTRAGRTPPQPDHAGSTPAFYVFHWWRVSHETEKIGLSPLHQRARETMHYSR